MTQKELQKIAATLTGKEMFYLVSEFLKLNNEHELGMNISDGDYVIKGTIKCTKKKGISLRDESFEDFKKMMRSKESLKLG